MSNTFFVHSCDIVEIIDWVKTHNLSCPRDWTYYQNFTEYKIWFNSEEMAVLFKLWYFK